MARKKFKNNDSKLYHEWLEKAGEDMIAASMLLNNDYCIAIAAFHCQQAVEKALKAYLILKTDKLHDGHNLTWLCKQAKRFDDSFGDWIDESVNLNRCYIESRYPTDLPYTYSDEYVRSAFKMAKDMFIFICQQVDGELDAREWLGEDSTEEDFKA